MAGGGVGDVSCAQQPGRGERRGRRQKAASLPFEDVIAEIAARSDPADHAHAVRGNVQGRAPRAASPRTPASLIGRLHLRLRDTDRFVLPLLRGDHDIHPRGEDRCVYMVDTTAASDATRLVKVTFPFAEADEILRNDVPLDSRGGLVLVRNNTHHQRQLLVCNLATRRCLALPPEPAFPEAFPNMGVQYVLLVGDSDGEGAGVVAEATVDWPFQVLKEKLVLSCGVSWYHAYARQLVHTFSSEHGAWSPLTEILIPNLHGNSGKRWSRPLVVGYVMHWLCMTDSGSYMLMLHVGTARVNVTSLPASFPHDAKNNHAPLYNRGHQYLLATATAGGNPVVLVADTHRISAWEKSKHTKMWKSRPQALIENETILGFKGLAELVEKERRWGNVPEILWFSERSGAVLLWIQFYLLWLDLHSKKIVRCFSLDHRMEYAQVYCPYDVQPADKVLFAEFL